MPAVDDAPQLVGRVTEREALAALTDSLGPAGGAAMLVGEAGMGKTALLSTLAAAVSSRPAVRVTWLRGTESEAVLPFAAIADLLLPFREHFGLLPDGQRQALGACLGLSDDPPGGPLKVHAGALSVLAAAADRNPVLILVDDFQWLDPESQKILLFIARRVAAEPIVMVIAAREYPGSAVMTGSLPVVRLTGLSYNDCAELARQRQVAITPSNLRSLVERSGGNPLVVLGNLDAAGSDEMTGHGELVLHSSLNRVWGQVLADLPAEAQRALFVAVAAFPAAGSPGLREALEAAGLSLASLEAAERRDLVRVVDGEVRLCHPLLRPVVLDRTPLADRVAVYQALARASQGSVRAWYLAAAATGPDEQVATALVAAAEDARQRRGYGASARAWRRASDLSPSPADRVRRLAAGADDAFLAGDLGTAVTWGEEALRECQDPRLAGDIKLILGRARTWMGEPSRSYDDLVQAAALVHPTDRRRAAALLAEAAAPAAMAGHVRLAVDAATRSLATWQSSGISPDSGLMPPYPLAVAAQAYVLEGSVAKAERLLDLAEKALNSVDQVTEQQGFVRFAACLVSLERYEEARGQVTALIGAARYRGAPAVLAVALGVRSELEWWTGQWAPAYADATESLQWAEETGQSAAIGYSLALLARIDAARGNQLRCQEQVDRANREVEMRGVGCLAVYNAAALGLSALSGGDVMVAVHHLERAWDTAISAGLNNPNVVPFAGDLAEALARANETARASEVLAWLRERADTTHLRYPRSAAARGYGLLSEDPEAAREWFTKGLAACQDRPMPFERARTLLCQGEALRRTRQPAAARDPLRHALAIFSSLGAAPWAARTTAELTAAGGRGPAAESSQDTAARLADLTPQELQIARAVGRGLNNAEAAAALFVSRKTVEAHLTRAYRKLGVRSRSELTLLLASDAADPGPAAQA